MIQNDEIKQLFKMYLEGKTNAAQEKILFRYLRDNQNAESELSDIMERAWQNDVVAYDKTTDAEEGLEDVWAKIGRRHQHKANRFRPLKYAASIILLCSAALIWYQIKSHKEEAAELIRLVSKTTESGKKVKILLPDSSVVYLGSETKISWPEHFESGKPRYVTLEGEAFFEVRHEATRPFIIKSGRLETRVLGTSFNVYAYPSDNTVAVTVQTGKVGVIETRNGTRTTLALLTPGMGITYHNDSHHYKVSQAETGEPNSWISNRFTFRDEKLGDMLFKLQRYYNVRFEIKNPRLADCRFNATFLNQNINGVMQQLHVMSSGHIKYKINNNQTIVLWGETCE